MNRRLFLASLFAPFAARFAPKPDAAFFAALDAAYQPIVAVESLGYVSLSEALTQLCDAAGGFTWSVTPDKAMRFESKGGLPR